MDKRSILLAALFLAGFLLISTAIYFTGKSRYQMGEGLASTESREIIVQLFARSFVGPGVYSRPERPAIRISLGQSQSVPFSVRNLENKNRELHWRVKIEPEQLSGDILQLKPSSGKIDLAAMTTEQILVELSFAETHPNSRDGTLDLTLLIEEPSAEKK